MIFTFATATFFYHILLKNYFLQEISYINLRMWAYCNLLEKLSFYGDISQKANISRIL